MNAIHTDAVHSSGLPFSQAIEHDDTVFVSGMTPKDPATGEFVHDEIGDQTAQCFENMATVLESAGSSLDDLVKVTVFMEHRYEAFDEMNAVYRRYVSEPLPARSTIGVTLSREFDIEIEGIALNRTS